MGATIDPPTGRLRSPTRRRAARWGLLAAALALVVPPAEAAPSASVERVQSSTGATTGSAVPITARIKISGAPATSTLTARLEGKRRYTLAGELRVPTPRSGTLSFAPTVPGHAKLGEYRLVVCVRVGSSKARCRTSKRKVAIVTFRAKPNPLKISPTLDPGRAGTATIGPAGGTLTTTAADGAVATLTVPKNALVEATAITMTPLMAIGGHPAKPSVAAGVELTPSGLQFETPATLELKPKAKTHLRQRGVITADGDGGNAGPDLFRDTKQGAMLKIEHFSSYTLAYVQPRDRIGMERLIDGSKLKPVGDLAQLRAQVAEELARVRRDYLLGNSDPDSQVLRKTELMSVEQQARFIQLLEGYYEAEVLPLLRQALGSCELAPLALQKALSWERQVQLLQFSDFDEFAEKLRVIGDLKVKIIQNGLRCFHERCVRDNYPEAFEDYVQLLGKAQLLAITPPYELHEEARRCLRFKLEFTSELTIADVPSLGQSGTDYHYTLSGEVALPEVPLSGLEPPPSELVLEYDRLTGTHTSNYPAQCEGLTITERAARGNAGSIRISASGLAPYREVGRTTAAFQLMLDFPDPYVETGGLPFETYGVTSTGVGPGCSDTYETDGHRWAKVFVVFADRWSRSDAPQWPAPPYAVKGFTRGVAPVFLERIKRDVGDISGWPSDMTTTIRIVHTPIRVG